MTAAVVVLAATLALGPAALAVEAVKRARRLRARARLSTERGRWVRVVRVDASEGPAEFLEEARS